jgi:hypothetical protein
MLALLREDEPGWARRPLYRAAWTYEAICSTSYAAGREEM